MTQVLNFSTSTHKRWRGKKRYIRVYIYDTQEELQKAASIYNGPTPIAQWKGTLACYQPIWIHEREESGKWVRIDTSAFAGVIRLIKDEVNAYIITHEIIHAAAAIYRMDIKPSCNLGTECLEAEENFAYLVGDLTASLSIQLHKHNAWTKEIVK